MPQKYELSSVADGEIGGEDLGLPGYPNSLAKPRKPWQMLHFLTFGINCLGFAYNNPFLHVSLMSSWACVDLAWPFGVLNCVGYRLSTEACRHVGKELNLALHGGTHV